LSIIQAHTLDRENARFPVESKKADTITGANIADVARPSQKQSHKTLPMRDKKSIVTLLAGPPMPLHLVTLQIGLAQQRIDWSHSPHETRCPRKIARELA
jgi:hypothetical protein